MESIQYWKNRVLELEKELNKARTDKTFGIYSRYGIESIASGWEDQQVYVLFADLDEIHKLNAKLGYQKVDKKINSAFKAIKEILCDNDYLARWYSGDEWILISKSNPEKYVKEIFDAFHLQGINLTIATNYSDNFTKLGDIVYPTSKKVQYSKKYNIRNKYIGSV